MVIIFGIFGEGVMRADLWGFSEGAFTEIVIDADETTSEKPKRAKLKREGGWRRRVVSDEEFEEVLGREVEVGESEWDGMLAEKERWLNVF